MKFNVPKHLSGRAKLAELTRQAARPPMRVTYPSKPLLERGKLDEPDSPAFLRR